jgi:hypothetical protein
MDDLVCQIIETVQSIFPEHLADLFSADMVSGDLRSNVSDHLIRSPDIPANHIEDGLVGDASVIKFDEWDEETLFEDIMVV